MNSKDEMGAVILQNSERIIDEITKNPTLALYAKIANDKQLINKINSLGALKAIVVQSIQTGNIKRASRYLLLMKKIQSKIFIEDKVLRNRITHNILHSKKITG
jgi:hypothetical protein